MSSPVFKIKRHDTGVSPVMTFTPPAGTTWDLSEAGIAVKFIARLPTANAPKINAAAVVTGPWTVRYDPLPVDVNEIGAYDVEVEIVRSNTKKITLPTEGFLSLVVAADLDDA